ncbi:putative bifunctional diguanylate cyclase/phosphodiesterase [Shewanella litorisediminis]|uniref:Bifunctional diguanylate cyclase/phosphodiesterase n=1 Tax=Shewanella litorisediminis TaxID=1173586 RepID=A0ABX7G3B3_9GAMM|nr:bifunctional diguanylate cyclase/phosphodiesterase [Shewanella litorisediminis]MCL2917342.1 bifunctional diguanylate cyclase/phosphodiesterase [Shewanella litorisediminis]QRH01810.1 bifunctional diguanylate cyclase/phosphodiesterase [Shewanella litorisediminis]
MDRAVISALRVAIIYAVFAGFWILFSDIAVELLLDSAQLRAIAQTYKGLAFVIITATLLLMLVLRSNRALEKANEMDSLTGLSSLSVFIRSLNNTIRQLKPTERLILGYLDIDDFKRINDTLGYERADAFLRDLANDINDAALPGSVVSRLHADQFASFGRLDASVDMEAHVRGFQRMFAHRARQHGIDATCCIGVALFPADGTNAKEMMVSATEALNIAKKKKNAIQYHDKELSEKALQRRQLVMDLRQAITDESLTLVYQPKYDLTTLTACGIEVLVRWHHPVKGYISPDVFIPLAEEIGLTAAISRLVVDKAAAELGSAGVLGGSLTHVAVNVSADEFNNADEMYALTQFIKSKEALAPYVRIEITETATLTDMQKSVEIISNLQASGVTFSIDDFGTGYTSLAMLKDLTVDEIKIDRSFVSGVETDERSRTIVSAIVAMAQSFDIHIVAEGVENAAQLKILQDMGCQQAQGFYLGRPMALHDLVKHLNEDGTSTRAAH